MVYNTEKVSQVVIDYYAENLLEILKENFRYIDKAQAIKREILRAKSEKDWISLMFLGKEIDIIILDYRLTAAEEIIRDLSEKVDCLENFGKKTE